MDARRRANAARLDEAPLVALFGRFGLALSLLVSACAVDPSGLGGVDLGDGSVEPVDVGPTMRDVGVEDADVPQDVGTPDAGFDAFVPCADNAVRCGIAGVERCVDGSFQLEEACSLGCRAGGSPRCVRFMPSNVEWMLLPPPGGVPVEIDGGSFDTSDCVSFGGTIGHQSDGAPELCIVTYDGDVTLRGEVRIRGFRPFVALVGGSFEIATGARLDLRAEGTSGGPGGGGSESGLFAGGRGRESGSYDDGGGGGGGACGPGGTGGRGRNAAGGDAGGSHAATFMLSPLYGGSGGGRAARSPGDAGGGGGALQISARGAITLRGTIDVAGAGGRGGASSGLSNRGSGGGGGSGGSVLLESPVGVRIDESMIWAGGGGGGSGATFSDDGNHGTHGHVDPPSGGPSPGSQGARGGDGGRDGMGEPGGDTSDDRGNGGGAGGGAGCIVVRTPGGTLSAPGGLGVLRAAEPVLD